MKLRQLLGASVGMLLAAAASAQTVTTVVNNGPPGELYDMVILGDGYRSTEQARFNQDVADCVAYFQNQASMFPYGDYFQCYNVHSVFRASVESGADDPCANPVVTRNTVYDAEYCWGGTQRCLYIRNTAQAATDAALAPDTDGRVIVLVNDSQYGGCASTYAVSYNGASMEEVNCHEWGHSFGLLADEYDYGNSGPYVGGEPSAINCTASTTGNAKWPLWVGATGQYGTVGAYAGACYYPPTPTPTLYRPEANCEMRELSRRFCTICREQFIKRFHEEVNMIDNAFRSPAAGSVAQHSVVRFGFTNRISNRPHTIQWRIDGGGFFSGTNSFYWNVGAASAGNHTITVRLTDTSPEVRNDPGNLLRHEFSWTVNVIAGNLVPVCTADEVLPSTLDGVEGNSSSSYPFGRTGEMRLMMAYGPTALGVNGPTRFDGIGFRPDGGATNIQAGSYRMQVYVSTSRNPATNLSRTFESNHGVDRVLLYNSTLAVAAQSVAGSPSPFALKIPFTRAFEWDPRYGPLLVEIRMISVTGFSTTAWDGPNATSDDVGRIANLADYTATTADFPASGTQNFALAMSLCEECEIGPNAYATTEAGSSSGYPFNVGINRTLMAYDRSIFDSDFGGRHRITKLAFRPDAGAAINAFALGMTVDMSTGITPANALSTTFANNHGTDKRRVWSGPINFPAQPASSNPAGFSVEIPLQTPFEYDPAAGPLVVEFVVTGGNGLPGANFDGPFNTGELIGRVFSATPSATTGSAQNFGLVMCVVSEPCPTLPQSADGSFANSSSAYPWGTAGQQRAMYAYDSTSVGTTKPITIQHLRWRPDSGATSIGPVSYDVRIDMSTSGLASASAITTTFATNHGSNLRTVFNGTVSIPYTPLGTDPRQFPLSIELDSPFYWNPASGPLIVDIRSNGIIGGSNSAIFDGQNGASTYRVVHLTNRNATTADLGPQSFALALSLCGVDCNGTAVNYGASCVGSAGTPINSTVGLPSIPNPNFAYRMRNGPPSRPAALWVGLNPLSFDLSGLGATSCFLLNTLDLASFTTATNASGIATIASPIPNDPLINGLTVYTQWIAVDPGAPRPLGVVTTDGQRIRLCF